MRGLLIYTLAHQPHPYLRAGEERRMTKAELLRDLDSEYKGFEQLLNDIGEDRMEQPGVAGHWSIKDIVAHISSWRERTVQRLESAATGKPLPPKPWPDSLNEDDPINAWFY